MGKLYLVKLCLNFDAHCKDSNKQGPFHSNKYFVTKAEIIAASAGARFQGNFLIGMLYLFWEKLSW